MGLSVTRNVGVENASGDYIMFIDSDDWIEHKMLELMHSLAINQNSDLVLCDYTEYYKNNTKICEQNLFLQNKYDCVPAWAKLYKTNFWLKHKFAFFPKVCPEDIELMPKIMFNTSNISYLNIPLYNYERRNLNSITNTVKLYDSYHLIINSYCDYFKNKPIDINLAKFIFSKFCECIIYSTTYPKQETIEFFKGLAQLK